MAGRFGLDAAAAEEARVTLEAPDVMRCFGEAAEFPEGACRDVRSVEASLRRAQQ